MDNMDDSETNAKISDSAYSNSCSNSQSRRSSKSTHSGSNSSGSSGYGGKPSTSGYSNNQSESKKKQQTQLETLNGETRKEKENCLPEPATIFESPTEDTDDGVQSPSQDLATPEKAPESMDIATSEGSVMNEDLVNYGPTAPSSVTVSMNYVTSRPHTTCLDGFLCVISLHDGVVMYTTTSLSSTLGFPKDMWIGRSFIDFVHPRDRNAFASQITNGLAVPKNLNVNPLETSISSMVCRIRRYKDLASGFAVKNSVIIYMPFLLKLSFKNVNGEEGKITYLVIQAAPFFSAFKIPNECILKPVPFIIRHAANGKLEYLDPESMPYLGYLPQDVTDMDALLLYHPCDLLYIRQVYEIIVKEGGTPRSKPYRMMTQNGDYVVLETEWSSFVNPWSKKLEFVIGKHFITEGPANPDVFQSPDPNKGWKLSEEEKLKAQILRDSILKVLKEALTKPAEMAKQLMSKRCQELATFMETLLEDQPKVDEEMRLEIQDPENSYCERDSVMLGGISPHHDYNDGKSGTETPVSYTQLNYNDTLQRYFESNLPFSNEDYNTVTGEIILATNEQISNAKECTLRSVGTDNTGESSPALMKDVGSLVPMGNYHPVRLTESRLSKHNVEMEKELVKMHRESRSSSRGDKEKNLNENRQKKKEHLARCNASFQPTSAGMNITEMHGVKRNLNQLESEPGIHKHHCSSPRQARRRLPAPAATLHINPAVTSAPAPTPWTSNSMNNMNGLVFGVGIPQQMSIMSPMVVPMPGMFPMQYVSTPESMQQMIATTTATTTATATATTTSPSTAGNAMPGSSLIGQYQVPQMPCMMYGQAMYGTPFVYSPVGPQIPYPIQQSYMPHGVQYVNNPKQLNPLGLTSSNYVEACKSSLPRKTVNVRAGSVQTSGVKSSKAAQDSLISNSSVNESQRSTDAVQDQNSKTKAMKLGNSEDTIDRTDGESSYSSFYSSFFRTESGSAEESSDAKKLATKNVNKNQIEATSAKALDSQEAKKNEPCRKMEPPWMDKVCVSSELIYKYQIITKSVEEVLASDRQKMKTLQQPSLVNEQLSQLYLDLQLEGVASRLTLEEGITSSSSSGEENLDKATKTRRKNKEYSKLVMIYEENAPLPPPDSPPGPATF